MPVLGTGIVVTDTVVQFQNATYRIGTQALVSDLCLDVYQGETLVLLGRSGSGKTTTLRMINGLLLPQKGKVFLNHVPTEAWDPIQLRRKIGYVIQDVGLFPHMSVQRNAGMVPFLEGWEPESIRKRVRNLLDFLGLEPDRFGNRFPDELSGGQRQRVGIARALAADPPLLIMDEPFSALDALTRLQIQEQFLALQQELKKTVVIVTHDVQEALMLANRIGVMHQGRLVEIQEPSGFLNSENPEVRGFVQGLGAVHGYGSIARRKDAAP